MIMLFPQPPEVWNGGVGFVSKEMVQTHCPAPAPDIQVYYQILYILYQYAGTILAHHVSCHYSWIQNVLE